MTCDLLYHIGRTNGHAAGRPDHVRRHVRKFSAAPLRIEERAVGVIAAADESERLLYALVELMITERADDVATLRSPAPALAILAALTVRQ